MAIECSEEMDGKILIVRATGLLTKQDYQCFKPKVDELTARHGKIRILFEMHDVQGWKTRALWEDIKLACGHFTRIERIAMVGDRFWEHSVAVCCRPFTMAKVRYFDLSEQDEAREWIGLEPARQEELVGIMQDSD